MALPCFYQYKQGWLLSPFSQSELFELLYIAHIHFKMKSLTDVLHMLKTGVWMASVDLTMLITVFQLQHTISLIFLFYGRAPTINIRSCQMAIHQGPMLFTKVLRPPFAYLHRQGHISVVYMDDTYLQGDSFVSCQQNVYAPVNLLQDLGFNVNRNPAASGKMSNILDITKLSIEPMKLTESFQFFLVRKSIKLCVF